uniref:Uncharacterized protein n=1 Tax=Panagrolaimus davidi TaxID=227884 RepID=A0A914PLE6_9BILA
MDKLSFTISVDVDGVVKRAGQLENLIVDPGAKIRDITHDVTSKEIVYKEDSITFCKGDSYNLDRATEIFEKSYALDHPLTAKELADIICDFEKEARVKFFWFGGVDVHHIYFEAFDQVGPKKYQIYWGS